ncbi:hypothetical protein A2697_02640 [Candidatus Curtissbacteria bacterium RIFCSPHIGHO2_01_FULL_41_44]|uniref:DUF4411 family protein n=1 Tax=Candidatus Curtissbacteria bacterium RIFCSPLOWO2_01_FULL_42_50 TaxID=1797730 RepID=A0A1F5H2D7_9BACT|nr:MAG: hypothetical protein A2697_02640 [Candidatus Curtissbacteria bacterium RIFCSPHIGHO2_01_FULL_41_44]OGD92875.1 MAG: hypothetical protein A3C33_02155 [Candidatus Curtissbacteria bacterium RIFCSPHIGHO2_02_FULL_42_58]OGD96592.1 MAG: hypothetical protein A3E71_02805 [Candidatus Curtissbacteria bacterium RIFCSPHIGHO2_12_FULL_42_33]OGD98293.1 MAG: hypothetical protein A3B54_04245 [Candidatus Curtissbacteria bacterium RIFCSPLOWO2_01_FULL_42_50]OGE10365.1 MAG: hypothetical protein A3H87_02165 [Ca
MNQYIVDTDVIIGFYDSLPMDVYKTQWKLIGKYIEDKRIVICEAVFNEIKKAEELKQWLNNYRKDLIPCYTQETLIEAKVIINKYPKLIDVNNTSDQSDPYVIALAKLKKLIVLSNESYSEGGKKTKIPYICKDLGIICRNTREFYKDEQWQF